MSPNWISIAVIFAVFSAGCSSDAGDDPFKGGSSGGSTSQPGTAGRTGVAGSATGSGGQFTGAGGSAISAGGSSSLGGSGGSTTVGAGGFVSGVGGTNAGGTAGQTFGSAGAGGRSFGAAGSAGHGGQSTSGGAGGGSSATWTEIYTKFISNAQYTSNCTGSSCHSPGKQKGYDFSSKATGYASVKSNTTTLVNELSSGGMPKGKPKMPAADLAVIKAWVAAGALDN